MTLMSLLYREMCVERPWGSQKLPGLRGSLPQGLLAAGGSSPCSWSLPLTEECPGRVWPLAARCRRPCSRYGVPAGTCLCCGCSDFPKCLAMLCGVWRLPNAPSILKKKAFRYGQCIKDQNAFIFVLVQRVFSTMQWRDIFHTYSRVRQFGVKFFVLLLLELLK